MMAMDDKMKAALRAWQAEYYEKHDRNIVCAEVVNWTLDYLRSQQEPEVWSSKSWIKEATDGKSGYIVGEARAGFTVPLYTDPVPSAPAVPDRWKLVPTEPTETMQIAAGRILLSYDTRLIYRTMLAAAQSRTEKKES